MFKLGFTGLLALALGLGLLSACGKPIEFATDPRILRGNWVGTLREPGQAEEQALRLELTATYTGEYRYAVAGDVYLEGVLVGELSGTAFSGVRLLESQTSPPPHDPPELLANVESPEGDLLYGLCATLFNPTDSKVLDYRGPVFKVALDHTVRPLDCPDPSIFEAGWFSIERSKAE